MNAYPEDEPRYFCLACRDESSSLRVFWCPGRGPARDFTPHPRAEGAVVECGRAKTHGPHSYATRCECAGSNPVAAARREREARRQSEDTARMNTRGRRERASA